MVLGVTALLLLLLNCCLARGLCCWPLLLLVAWFVGCCWVRHSAAWIGTCAKRRLELGAPGCTALARAQATDGRLRQWGLRSVLGWLLPELADKFRMLDASTSNDYQGFCSLDKAALLVGRRTNPLVGVH